MLPFVVTIFPTFAILLFLRRALATYFVREDGLELEFGFTGWSVRFVYTDIIEAQPVDIRWISWKGFGWRWRHRLHRSQRSWRTDCHQTIGSLAHFSLSGLGRVIEGAEQGGRADRATCDRRPVCAGISERIEGPYEANEFQAKHGLAEVDYLEVFHKHYERRQEVMCAERWLRKQVPRRSLWARRATWLSRDD